MKFFDKDYFKAVQEYRKGKHEIEIECTRQKPSIINLKCLKSFNKDGFYCLPEGFVILGLEEDLKKEENLKKIEEKEAKRLGLKETPGGWEIPEGYSCVNQKGGDYIDFLSFSPSGKFLVHWGWSDGFRSGDGNTSILEGIKKIEVVKKEQSQILQPPQKIYDEAGNIIDEAGEYLL